jgi:hypothetical protein
LVIKDSAEFNIKGGYTAPQALDCWDSSQLLVYVWVIGQSFVTENLRYKSTLRAADHPNGPHRGAQEI